MVLQILRFARGQQTSLFSFRKKVGGKWRTTLVDTEKAKIEAKKATTRLINQGVTPQYFGRSMSSGDALYKGINKLGEMASPYLTEEELASLRSMDAGILNQLYYKNKFLFNVAYQYDGINENTGYGEGTLSVDETKADELRFLISEYDRFTSRRR